MRNFKELKEAVKFYGPLALALLVIGAIACILFLPDKKKYTPEIVEEDDDEETYEDID